MDADHVLHLVLGEGADCFDRCVTVLGESNDGATKECNRRVSTLFSPVLAMGPVPPAMPFGAPS